MLCLGLIGPAILQLWRNRRPFRAWWRQPPMPLALGFSALAVLPFLWPAENGRAGGPPQFALAPLVLAQSPERIAPLLGHSPQTLAARLADQGIAITDPARPLSAAAPQADEATLAAALLAAANRGAQPD